MNCLLAVGYLLAFWGSILDASRSAHLGLTVIVSWFCFELGPIGSLVEYYPVVVGNFWACLGNVLTVLKLGIAEVVIYFCLEPTLIGFVVVHWLLKQVGYLLTLLDSILAA